MTKKNTLEDLNTITHLYFSRKFKQFKLLEPFLAFLGFTLGTCLLTTFFFYLNHQAITFHGYGFPWFGISGSAAPSALDNANANQRRGFLDEGGDSCDVYDGKWVWDDNYPLYQSPDCPFMDSGFRCSENGRPDGFYTKWRWQPKGCNLPRFADYNCTVEYYRAPSLVAQGSAPPGAPKGVKMTLRLDSMIWNQRQWADADVLVFNSGHWWSREKTINRGCFFQEGTEVNLKIDPLTAFQKSIETVLDFVRSQVNTNKTQVFFRTYAPSHFRGGAWNSGGHCHQIKLPYFGPFPDKTDKRVKKVRDVLSKHPERSKVMEMMNVTPMTYQRQDGHTSLYHFGRGNESEPAGEDCSHWCLPGVPDSWNELLYALFLKLASVHSSMPTVHTQARL